MSLRCLLALTTSHCQCYAAVCVQTLHQLAELMPAAVVTYKIESIEEVISPAKILDEELYLELVEIIVDSERSSLPALANFP